VWRQGTGVYYSIIEDAQAGVAHSRHTPGVHHIAFAAPTRLAVDDLYQSLIVMHATILDPPRDYPQYEAGYYAVFFLDPDGIKLEYVFTPDE